MFEDSPIFSKEFEYVESWEQQEPSETMQAREKNRKDSCKLVTACRRKSLAY